MFEGAFVDGILKTKATDRSLTLYHKLLLASNCLHVVSRSASNFPHWDLLFKGDL